MRYDPKGCWFDSNRRYQRPFLQRFIKCSENARDVGSNPAWPTTWAGRLMVGCVKNGGLDKLRCVAQLVSAAL